MEKSNFLYCISFRLANLLQTTHADKIWSAVRKIKLKTPIEYDCDETQEWFNSPKQAMQVTAVESELDVNSSNETLKNISAVHLETAGKMFIYLNTCAGTDSLKEWFKLWSRFYNDLFQTFSVDYILLTLNRMMKDETKGNRDAKLRAQKLFQRMKTLFSLEYEEFQSMQGVANVFKRAQGI